MKNILIKSKEKIKGFTLIEIIVCLIIITCIGTGSAIGINNAIKTNKEKELKNIYSNFNNALQVYLTNNNDILANINNYAKGSIITLETLKNEGLIEDYIINPTTNKKFDYKNNYYLVSNAILLKEGETPTLEDCVNRVELNVIAKWDLNNLTEEQKSNKLYICPNDIDSIKSSLTGIDGKITNLETEIENLKEAIKELQGVKTEDIKQQLIYSSIFENTSYIAKGTNPNNYVYFEVESKPTEFAYFPNTENKGLWRIITIDENDEIKLVYNEPVLSNNQLNYGSSRLIYYGDNQDTFYKLKHVPEELKSYNYYSDSYYYKYSSDTVWIPYEILEDVKVEGSKKSYLYDSIVNKNWIIKKKYYNSYVPKESSTVSFNSSLAHEMKMGAINYNDIKNTESNSQSWLHTTSLLGYIRYTQNFTYYDYYVTNSNANLNWSNTVVRFGKSSDGWTLNGNNYYPVITLNNKVELVEPNCAEGVTKGSKECPYKLKCTEC